MAWIRLEQFEKFLRDIAPRTFNVNRVLESRSGQILARFKMEDGTENDQSLRFHIYREQGLVQIKPLIDFSSAPSGIAEDKIRQIIHESRTLVREYWVRNKIKAKIEDLEQYLNDRFYGETVCTPNENFATLEKYLQKVIDADELEFSDLPLRAMVGSGTQMHLPAVVLTLVYCREAEEALSVAEYQEASYWAGRSQYWSSTNYFREDPNKRTRDRASAAAKARTQIHVMPLKKQIAQILRDPNTPVFKKMAKAARYIADEGSLWRSYVEKNGNDKLEEDFYLKADSFEKTLYSWIREDEELRSLFESGQTQKQD
jgi:hypothetical protein